MAGESVNENIYLAITFGYGGQKRFSQTATCHSRALVAIVVDSKVSKSIFLKPPTIRTKMRLVVFIVLILPISGQSQILENSLFRIYRSPFISGAVTQLRIDNNNNYEMTIQEFTCSLCDVEELKKMINSKGHWTQKDDTIHLHSLSGQIISLRIMTDSKLKPTSPIGLKTDSIKDSIKRQAFIKRFQFNDMETFYLTYDTYPNGIARLIVDKYRMLIDEYEIEIKENGSIKRIDYYRDHKRRKRIRRP